MSAGGPAGRGASSPCPRLDLSVERLEQHYLRTDDQNTQERYLYSAPRFDYSGELIYDAHGLLLDYPGIAERVA